MRIRYFGSTIPQSVLTEEVGGADRDRTDDPLLAKQVLSQLSYSPVRFGLKIENPDWRIYRFASLNSQSNHGEWWA